MAIFTVSLEESMDASDIDKNPLWESMSVLDETNANQSLAHKSLSEATSLLDEVIMNWTNSTVHTQNVGEYLWAVDTVSGILLGNIYTENMTEAITVLEEVGKETYTSLTEAVNAVDAVDAFGGTVIEAMKILNTVIATAGKTLSEASLFAVILSREIEANRAIDSGINISDYVSATLNTLDTCPTVINDHIHIELYSDASVNIDIKLPEFKDKHTLQTSIITQEHIYIKRDLYDDKIIMDFSAVTDKQYIIDFYNASRGLRVLFTDQYDNEFLGYLTNQLSVKTVFEDTCDDYGFTLIFEGKML